ncbi:hypothetical protein BT69DRAFT_1284447 [Atractiella rhizophila]|nr:hypothetical protein BT69DRAFT_1284447 [Atractiella rhizophila]
MENAADLETVEGTREPNITKGAETQESIERAESDRVEESDAKSTIDESNADESDQGVKSQEGSIARADNSSETQENESEPAAASETLVHDSSPDNPLHDSENIAEPQTEPAKSNTIEDSSEKDIEAEHQLS